MAINYRIAADVVDIRKDSPREQDIFLVDTHIWYWITYTRASLSNDKPMYYQTFEYPEYINKALDVNTKLYRCGLSFAELAHLIEKAEREIFARLTGSIGKKEYRHHYPVARNDMVKEVNSAWGQVKTMALPLDIAVDETLISAALRRFEKECLDGYDVFFAETMSKAGVAQLITDDGDFSTVAGIVVFTANEGVINAAQQQAKLIKR